MRDCSGGGGSPDERGSLGAQEVAQGRAADEEQIWEKTGFL